MFYYIPGFTPTVAFCEEMALHSLLLKHISFRTYTGSNLRSSDRADKSISQSHGIRGTKHSSKHSSKCSTANQKPNSTAFDWPSKAGIEMKYTDRTAPMPHWHGMSIARPRSHRKVLPVNLSRHALVGHRGHRILYHTYLFLFNHFIGISNVFIAPSITTITCI